MIAFIQRGSFTAKDFAEAMGFSQSIVSQRMSHQNILFKDLVWPKRDGHRALSEKYEHIAVLVLELLDELDALRSKDPNEKQEESKKVRVKQEKHEAGFLGPGD
ncbi:MAG: hypothetical protein EBX40_07510 [Gammaproteobacteria bacterium]|nr:hypothetical protein [Gammaproteobacteria bacterium]